MAVHGGIAVHIGVKQTTTIEALEFHRGSAADVNVPAFSSLTRN